MTAYADLSEYVNRKTGGNSGAPEYFWVHKEARVQGAAAVAPVIGRWQSMWQYEGSPSHGAVPTTVLAPDNTTAGGWKHTSPGGGRQKWLDFLWAYMPTTGSIVVYDRLLQIGGLSGIVVSPTAQTVGGTLTRNTTGAGNRIFVEIYTIIGASSTTITAAYTNQDGDSKTTQAVAIGNTGLREVDRMIPLSLAAGDYGVQAVASVTLAATTSTAGNFGVVVARPIAVFGCPTTGGASRSFLDGAMPDISNACLTAMYLPTATTAQTSIDFFASMAER